MPRKKLADDEEILVPMKAKHARKIAAAAKKGKKVMVGAEHCGEGFLSTVKAIGNSKITKGIAGALAPAVGDAIGKASGSNLAGEVAKGTMKAYAGSGFIDVMKSVGNSKITKGLAKTLAPVAAQAVAKASGSNLAGQVTGATMKAYGGSGIVPHADGLSCGGKQLPDWSGMTSAERMSHARSFRKKKVGGSFSPL
jgi:hypothetical protein